MGLSGIQKKRLRDAIVSAFPSRTKLAQLVEFRLDENLDSIVAAGDLNDSAFQLIQWAQSKGCTEKLIQNAYEENSGNPDLREFYMEWQNQRNRQNDLNSSSGPFMFTTEELDALSREYMRLRQLVQMETILKSIQIPEDSEALIKLDRAIEMYVRLRKGENSD